MKHPISPRWIQSRIFLVQGWKKTKPLILQLVFSWRKLGPKWKRHYTLPKSCWRKYEKMRRRSPRCLFQPQHLMQDTRWGHGAPPGGGRCTGSRGGRDHSPLQPGTSQCVSWWRSTYFSCFLKINDKERICRKALWCTGASTWWNTAAFNLDFKVWTTVNMARKSLLQNKVPSKSQNLILFSQGEEGRKPY